MYKTPFSDTRSTTENTLRYYLSFKKMKFNDFLAGRSVAIEGAGCD